MSAERIAYLLGVVAVGWAVTFALRSLPFVLFAGRDRKLPGWVVGFGNVVSPVIITGLIVYSYSGLEWKTAYPYLAGILTVGLQLWKGNPLMSILAGTALYMVLVGCCGCKTSHVEYELDAQHPALGVTATGVTFGGRYVETDEVVELLEDAEIPKTRTIHILLDPEVRDLKPARRLMYVLAKGGYTRPVLVTERKAQSVNLGKRRPKAVKPAERKKTVKYKKGN